MSIAATTHLHGHCEIGSCFVSFGVHVTGLGQSKAVPDSRPKPKATVSRCRHCDGEVVVHSTNGHLVLITLILITRLLSLSKIRAVLRVFYTMRYIDDAKGWLCRKF